MSAQGLTGPRPWEAEEFPVKPEGPSEYGYVTKDGKFVPCSRDQLIDWCGQGSFWGGSPVRTVWTPEHERVVVPERVPFLRDPLRRGARETAKSNIIWCGLIFAAVLALVAGFAESGRTIRFVAVFYLLPLAVAVASSARTLARGIDFTPEGIARAEAARRYGAWLDKRDYTYTKSLCACLTVVLVFGLPAGDEVGEAAGLAKGATRAGEWWRLVTCSMLHANFQHFWLNVLALVSLGQLVEAHASRWHLPLVFLPSVVAGSLASLWLLPTQTSVGASGGLMGLVGFLAVLGYRRRAYLPPSFLKSMVLDIALIGLVGLAAYDVIDNAAHFGGLAGGALAGLLLVGGGARADGLATPAGRGLRLAGNASFAALLVTAAATVLLLLRWYGR